MAISWPLRAELVVDAPPRDGRPIGGSLAIAPTGPAQPGWDDLLAFVAAETDPIHDLLLHADVVSDLGRLSRVWLARHDDGRAAAVAFAFPLHPARPALGVRGRTAVEEDVVIAALRRSGAWGPGYVICPVAQQPRWTGHGRAAAPHVEAHMVLEARQWRRGHPAHPAVRPAALDEVDAFYRRHGAEAWNPVQYWTGPYVVAEEAGEIVAAAGTHFAYPALAQVGNVLTAPAHRGRGWAKACTAAVTAALVERGYPVVSLFVAETNGPAVRVYEGLGYERVRSLAAFAWD